MLKKHCKDLQAGQFVAIYFGAKVILKHLQTVDSVFNEKTPRIAIAHVAGGPPWVWSRTPEGLDTENLHD